MTRSILWIIFLSWFETVLASHSSQLAKYPVNINIPLFSRGFKIVADSNSSHLLATLNLLYSIPKMQEIIYIEADKIISACPENECRKGLVKNSLIVSTAVALAHMRLSNEPLNLNDFFQDSLSAALGPPSSGRFIVLPQFLKTFFRQMPPGFASLYKYQERAKVFFESDESIKGSTILDSIMANYPLVGRNQPLSFYIECNFYEPKLTFQIEKDGKEAGLKYFASHEFLTMPEILFFNIPRLVKDGDTFRFKNEKIFIDRSITIKGNSYVLVGINDFDNDTNSYSSFVRDFGNLAVYELISKGNYGPLNDSIMQHYEDSNAVLLVYARADTFAQIDKERIKSSADIPESVKAVWTDLTMKPVAQVQEYYDLFETIPDSLFDLLTDNFVFSINPKTKLMAPKPNSFVFSLFMAFYNIPDIQQAFYNDAAELLSTNNGNNLSLNVAVAAVFAEMRLNGKDVDIENYLLEPLSRAFNNNLTETFVRMSTFFPIISKSFGAKVKEQIEIDSESKLLKAGDSTQIGRTVRKPVCGIAIPFTSRTAHSIAHYVANDFTDPKKIAQVNNPASTGEKVDVYLSTKVHRSSNYLLLDIGRVNSTTPPRNGFSKISMDTNRIWVNTEVIVNAIKYVLVAKIEFDQLKLEYSTIIKDFGSSKIYKFALDTETEVLEADKFADIMDGKSAFLIYAEEQNLLNSYWSDIKVPESLQFVIKELEEKSQQKTLLKKRKREEESVEENVEIYKPEAEFVKPEIEFKLALMRERNYPAECINVLSKYFYQHYQLGSEEYSFEQTDDGNSFSLALKFLLHQMASSVRFVKGLFEFVKNNPDRNLESKFAVVLVKMLMGYKNISLKELKIWTGNQEKFNINLHINRIISRFSASLISLPLMKKVTYSDLTSTDPENLETLPPIPVKTSVLIRQIPADIRGVWFDSKYKASKRVRSIYYSPRAIIFPIDIIQCRSKEVEFSSMDKQCDGFIAESSTNELTSYTFDKFTGKYRVLSQDGKSSSYAPDNQEFVRKYKLMKQNCSNKMFITSKDDQVQRILNGDIPRPIINLILKDILYEKSKKLNESESNK